MQGNQYAVTEYYTPVHKGDAHMPAVWFVYDISPISVSIARSRRSLAHLLVRGCAVVGGVFAVTGVRQLTLLSTLAPRQSTRSSAFAVLTLPIQLQLVMHSRTGTGGVVWVTVLGHLALPVR